MDVLHGLMNIITIETFSVTYKLPNDDSLLVAFKSTTQLKDNLTNLVRWTPFAVIVIHVVYHGNNLLHRHTNLCEPVVDVRYKDTGILELVIVHLVDVFKYRYVPHITLV